MNGWDAFDRMVLWAVQHSTIGSFGELIRLLPAGLNLRLIEGSLTLLASRGTITRHTAIVDGVLTRVYVGTDALERIAQAA